MARGVCMLLKYASRKTLVSGLIKVSFSLFIIIVVLSVSDAFLVKLFSF